jgi:hypothetical protein
MTERTCSLDGCEGRHHGRGLCSKHWKREYGKRYPPRQQTKYHHQCETCSKPFISTHPNRRFHSLLCYGIAYGWPMECTIPWRWCPGCERWWINRPARRAKLNTLPIAEKYCGRKCRPDSPPRSAWWGGNSISPATRKFVYARDGNRCQICKRKCNSKRIPNPRARTIDHVVPLSEGGDLHAPENMQTACFWCNAVVKNHHASPHGDQLRLM